MACTEVVLHMLHISVLVQYGGKALDCKAKAMPYPQCMVVLIR